MTENKLPFTSYRGTTEDAVFFYGSWQQSWKDFGLLTLS